MDKVLHEPGGKRLLRAVARGDKESFTRLYHLTSEEVLFFIRRIVKDGSLAEDVLVDTYSEVWRCAGSFKGRSKAKTWIMGIARNLAYKALAKNDPPGNDRLEDLAGPADTVRQVEAADRSRVLKTALEMLTPTHRETLDLVFSAGMTYKEVGEIMQVPENTVKTRIFHAKSNLLAALEQLGVTKDDLVR